MAQFHKTLALFLKLNQQSIPPPSSQSDLEDKPRCWTPWTTDAIHLQQTHTGEKGNLETPQPANRGWKPRGERPILYVIYQLCYASTAKRPHKKLNFFWNLKLTNLVHQRNLQSFIRSSRMEKEGEEKLPMESMIHRSLSLSTPNLKDSLFSVKATQLPISL